MKELGTVLLIDDSAVFANALRGMLETCATEVVSARSCAEAQAALEERDDFCLIVSDVVLPDGSGFDLLREQRALEASPPAILVTSRPTTGGASLAHRLGALDYLPKPLTLQDLVEVWSRHGMAEAPALQRGAAPVGHALLVDEEEPMAPTIAWEIESLRADGAFLRAEGPVEPGTRLTLILVVERERLSVFARVQSVHEPSWGAPGGLDVVFEELRPAGRRRLQAWIAGPDPATS